jgi:hypothetical protein
VIVRIAAMSETASPPAEAPPLLPLFFRRVVGVNPDLHGGLRLDRAAGLGYAATAQAVPIGLGEIEAAAQHYPILFTAGPNPAAVALLGLREGENLFVLPDGSWRADSYVPAYVRAFPFVFVEDAGTQALYVGMEPDADCLRPDSGTRLFEDGKPTAVLTESVAFCAALRDNLNATTALARALEAENLLEDEEANIAFSHGGAARVRGFRVVKPERLDQVSDETFLDWRRRGWIAAIYAHLYSMPRWGRLIELAAPAVPVTH